MNELRDTAHSPRDRDLTAEALKWIVLDEAHLAALRERYCTEGDALVDHWADDPC